MGPFCTFSGFSPPHQAHGQRYPPAGATLWGPEGRLFPFFFFLQSFFPLGVFLFRGAGGPWAANFSETVANSPPFLFFLPPFEFSVTQLFFFFLTRCPHQGSFSGRKCVGTPRLSFLLRENPREGAFLGGRPEVSRGLVPGAKHSGLRAFPGVVDPPSCTGCSRRAPFSPFKRYGYSLSGDPGGGPPDSFSSQGDSDTLVFFFFFFFSITSRESRYQHHGLFFSRSFQFFPWSGGLQGQDFQSMFCL